MSQTLTEERPGELLRTWRQRRHLSQLDLATRAGVSTRHVSFIETGRSRPTADMVLRLSDELAVPLRERNRLLLASGHAPAYPEHRLTDPPMAQANAAIEAILRAHLPYPALVIDLGWELVAANDAVWGLLEGLPEHVLEPPVNVVRLSLHPQGLAPRITNLDQWWSVLVSRIRHEHQAGADPRLAALLDELDAGSTTTDAGPPPDLVVPLRLRRDDGGELSLLSTTTVFGTPREVTLSELAIEAFYPADEETRRALLRG